MLPQGRLSRRDRAQAQDTPRLRTASALLAAALVTGAFLLAPDRTGAKRLDLSALSLGGGLSGVVIRLCESPQFLLVIPHGPASRLAVRDGVVGRVQAGPTAAISRRGADQLSIQARIAIARRGS